jgi:hypothetical protein
VHAAAGRGGGGGDRGPERRARGLGEADVTDDAVAEEAGRAPERPVDELIGEHEVARHELLAQRADR